MSRAVDETGYVQPTRAELLTLRQPGTCGYHLNPITGWVVPRRRQRRVQGKAVGMTHRSMAPGIATLGCVLAWPRRTPSAASMQ